MFNAPDYHNVVDSVHPLQDPPATARVALCNAINVFRY